MILVTGTLFLNGFGSGIVIRGGSLGQPRSTSQQDP